MKKSMPVFVLCAVTALMTAGVSSSPAAAQAVCRVLSDPLRRLLSAVSSLFPFPLFEVGLLALPLVLFLSFFRGEPSAVLRRVLSCCGILFSLFLLLSVVPAKRSAPPDPTPPTDGETTAFVLWLSERANGEEARLPAYAGSGTPPARETTAELSDAVCAALCESRLCPIEPRRVKATLFPGALSRSGLLGYHAPLTGEAVIDPRAPAYTLAFTAAHEAAHQAGVVTEGEASYIAYLALISSPDPALRYAGIAGALDACLPLLSDHARKIVLASLSPRVRADLRSFDAALPTGGGARIVEGSNAAAIRLRDGEDGRSYDLFPILACRRYLSASDRDVAAPSAIY